ncbi:hypothetical protein R1flu_027413 [Riccia fluitans]|uniref:Uncharacterized protein n=1 Tax=Riccia fluitans TaxID=41844 RepID=A0ABD1XIR0_9MARC
MQTFKPTCKAQVDLGVSVPCLWAALRDGGKLFPKIAPGFFSSIETLEGQSGEIGSITHTKFGPMPPGGEDDMSMTEQILDIDDETMTMKLAELERAHIAVGFTKWQPTIKLLPLGPDRIRLTSTVEYEAFFEIIKESS